MTRMTRTTTDRTPRDARSTGMPRALLVFLCLLLLPRPADARSWNDVDQRAWEDQWRALDKSRQETRDNNFKLVKLEEALAAQAAVLSADDQLNGWVGVLESIDLVNVKELGPCVVGEVALSDPFLSTPHRIRFVKPRSELVGPLEEDLTNAKTGGLVRVSGLVRSPIVSKHKKSKPIATRESFFDKCREVWEAIAGNDPAPAPRDTKPIPLVKLFSPPDPGVATLYVELRRLDPTWTPVRTAQVAQARKLEEEIRDIESRKNQLDQALKGLDFPTEQFGLEPPSSPEGEEAHPRVPAVEFQALQCAGQLYTHSVHLTLPWDGLPDLANLKTALDALITAGSQERFFEPTAVLQGVGRQVTDAYVQVRSGEVDRERLNAWLVRVAPDRVLPDPLLAASAKPIQNVLFALHPAAFANAGSVPTSSEEPRAAGGEYSPSGSSSGVPISTLSRGEASEGRATLPGAVGGAGASSGIRR